MDTYEQFRDSERRTFWLRVAFAFVAIAGSAAIPSASYSLPGAAVVAIAAVVSIGVVKLALLPRFHSDAWIYGQMAADALLGAGMLAVFGPLSPALAWPVFSVAYYSMFLGRYGAFASAAAGAISIAPAVALDTATFPAAPVVVIASLAGVASITSLISMDRFGERARRTEVEDMVVHEARSSRVLTGLMRMANAHGDREVAAALADAIRTASQYQAAVSFITRPSDGALVPISWLLDSGEPPSTGEAVELTEYDTPGVIAARQGTSSVLEEASDLPGWARELGFVSGIVLPVNRGMELQGIVYALRRQPSTPSVYEIEQMELIAAFASRMFSGAGAGAAPSAGMLDSFLSRRSHEEPAPHRAISLPGLSLDPGREHAELNGVSVSLSKTEFALLYALAGTPGDVLDAGTLARTCWEGETPNDNAVDVTVYRLRRKLSRVPGGGNLIRTVRGRGYALHVEAAETAEVTR